MSRCRVFHFRFHLPEYIAREILLRLPAKSVAMFRCVSTTWLSISMDPSFILAHARRAPKIFFVRTAHTSKYIKLPSFRLSTRGIGTCSLVQNSDEAMSSCDGLVCFSYRHFNDMYYYVQNPLSGLRISPPNLRTSSPQNSVCELYCHRWTGEYWLLNLSSHTRPNYHLKAAVLSLAGAYSSREIKVGVPYVSHFSRQSSVLVNDCLYWTCRRKSSKSISILVFNTLEERFSSMPIPPNGKKTFLSFENYGLVEMEGELGYWTADLYKSRSVLVEVWTLVNSDERWRNTHSLCLAGDAVGDISSSRRPTCLFAGFGEGELLCLFQDYTFPREAPYLLHWNLKSGNFYIEKLPTTERITGSPAARIYRETLIDLPSAPATMP